MDRIEFKVATLIHKSLFRHAPLYLKYLIEVRLSDERSSSSGTLLVVLRTRCLRYRDRRFSVFGAKAWNGLPQHVRDELDFKSFKLKLKTHLFRKQH